MRPSSENVDAPTTQNGIRNQIERRWRGGASDGHAAIRQIDTDRSSSIGQSGPPKGQVGGSSPPCGPQKFPCRNNLFALF